MNCTTADIYRSIIRLGSPITIGQLGIIVLSFADTMMVGRYSTDALAAASFVNNVLVIPAMLLIGFSNGLTPIVAALFARGDTKSLCTNIRVGFLQNLLLGIILTTLLIVLYFNLDKMGQPDNLLPLIRDYYLITLGGVLLIAVTNVGRQIFEATGSATLSMWILLGGNTLNIIFNYLLIFGKFGFPELGLNGAGISTIGSRIVIAIAFICIMALSHRYRHIFKGAINARSDRSTARKVLQTSWPVSLQIGIETGFFAMCGIMMGWIGEIQLAANQILITIGQLGFTIYMGYCAAVSICISRAIGVRDIELLRATSRCGYRLTLFITTISSAIILLFGEQLIRIFTTDVEVILKAVSLIPPLVLYQYADGTQIMYCNALRGTTYVKPLLIIAVVAYCIVNLPIAFALGFVAGFGEYGMYYSYSVGLGVAATLYYRYFCKKVKTLEQEFAA